MDLVLSPDHLAWPQALLRPQAKMCRLPPRKPLSRRRQNLDHGRDSQNRQTLTDSRKLSSRAKQFDSLANRTVKSRDVVFLTALPSQGILTMHSARLFFLLWSNTLHLCVPLFALRLF